MIKQLVTFAIIVGIVIQPSPTIGLDPNCNDCIPLIDWNAWLITERMVN